jgi:PRTRC genetic system ThiF family protein
VSKNTFHTPDHWLNREISVVLIGCGGTGSEMLDCLGRLDWVIRALGHPGLSVKVYDGDNVEAPNVGRSQFYPCDIGHNKAVLSVQRANIRWGLSWGGFPFHFQPTPDFFNKGASGHADLFITCVDKAQFRADFAKYARGSHLDGLFLDTGNGSTSGQVIMGHFGKNHESRTWLPNVFDYYPGLDGMEDGDTPSCGMEEAITRQSPPINRMIADAAYALLFNMIRFGGTEVQGCYIDSKTLSITPIFIP